MSTHINGSIDIERTCIHVHVGENWLHSVLIRLWSELFVLWVRYLQKCINRYRNPWFRLYRQRYIAVNCNAILPTVRLQVFWKGYETNLRIPVSLFLTYQGSHFTNMVQLYSQMINQSRKVWDEITYPFPNFNGCIVEVCEWISNFIPYCISVIITYPAHKHYDNERCRTSHVVECSVDVNRDISVCVSISVPGPGPTLGAKSSLASCQSSGWSVIWLAESCHSVCRKRTSLNSFADIVPSLGVCRVIKQTKGSFQYPIKRLIVRSRKVSKLWDLCLEFSVCSAIWQATLQHGCRGAQQIAKQYDDLKYRSCGFEGSRGPLISLSCVIDDHKNRFAFSFGPQYWHVSVFLVKLEHLPFTWSFQWPFTIWRPEESCEQPSLYIDLAQIRKALVSPSIRHRYDTFASDGCLIDVDPRVFALWS